MSSCTIPKNIDWAKHFAPPPGVENPKSEIESVSQSNERLDRMKKEVLLEIEGKQLTIKLDWDKAWKGAYCQELFVSGFGSTIKEALDSLAISIKSTLAILKRKPSGPAERAIEIVSSKPAPLPGTESHRFQDLLKRKGLEFASGNGLTLDELCDFIEKTTPDIEG